MIIVKNRKMVVPYDDMYIGTTYDDDSERRIFRIDRYAQNERDLSALTFRLDIKQPGQQADTVILDKDIDERYIYLTWNITNSVIRAVGLMFVQIRAIDDEATVKWSTYDAALYVARHLNTPGSYTGSLTEIEQIEQDHQYMKGVVDELKANIDYAHDAEAWAKGTRSGSAVPSTDPTYHNNSKYYSEQANTKATQAANSATAAANSATQAAETVSDTNTRFNNAMAAVTSETEVIDARVGADGTQYPVLKTRLDTEHTQLKSALAYNTNILEDNLSQVYGKNLFNPLWLIHDGIVNTSAESYGKTGDFQAIGKIPFIIPSGTQYTVSLEAYIEHVGGVLTNGFVMQFFRADGTTIASQIRILNTTSEWTEFHITPNINFGANGFQFAVGSGANNIVHLRNIQIEYGDTVTAYENSLTAYDKKAESDIASVSTDLAEVENNLSEFRDAVITESHSDLLYGKTPVYGKYCNPSTGAITNLAFYSILDITLPDDVTVLYPYNANDATNHALRSVCFYSSAEQNTETFISGQSGTAASVTNGISVPDNAVSCAVSIGNTSIDGEYYLSTVQGQDEISTYLDSEIIVNADQIVGLEVKNNVSAQLPNRKPTFTFIFDDGTDGDVNTKALFDSYGFKCGFALIGETSYLATRKERYLTYQDDGFEILSHSVNATAFSTVTNLQTAESYLKNSLSVLTANGFDVQGWVTPSSWLLAEQLPLVEKYYHYGYGHLSGTPEGTAYHQFIGLDIRQLDRWGLEGHTLEQTMAKIDEAITNNAYMIFYGHSYPSTENNMTVENMASILTYLKTKSDNGEIMVDTPRNTVNEYYTFRHSDLLDLYNRLNS